MQFRVALFAALACAFMTSAVVEGTAVVTLTEATFDKKVQDHVWFIKFYAPWCGHCKKLSPVFDQLSEDAKIEGTDVRIGKVDCTVERGICERFGVQSYPTLKVATGGLFFDYPKRREIPDMIEFIQGGYKKEYGEKLLSKADFATQKSQAAADQAEAERSSAVVAITSATFEDLVKNGDTPWILKFYAPWCGHCKRLTPTWHRLSKALQDTGSKTRVGKIDCTVHRRVCSRFGVNGYPTLFYVRDGIVYKYSGGRSVNAFVDFAKSGWESAESLGPIADESFFSMMLDSAVEWAAENTVLAVLAGILVIAIFVAILVALLDRCLGEDEVAAYRKLPRDVPGPADQAAGKPKAE